MKTLIQSGVLFVLTAPMAFSEAFPDGGPKPPSTSVPEISALEGTAALAAVAAIVLLAWERRSRA